MAQFGVNPPPLQAPWLSALRNNRVIYTRQQHTPPAMAGDELSPSFYENDRRPAEG